jgi:ubiquinone/menaquinone biosynthesis C-methylase UbiE
MERLKKCIKRWPYAYTKIQRWYYGLLYVGETYLLGTRIHELIWRHFRKVSSEEIVESTAHPHRNFLIEEIGKYSPFCRVLEIGCNAGQNLLLLARKYPDAELHGIDINPGFIETGKKWLRNEGVKNVSLMTGHADGLADFIDQSFDIVFTDAVLMYIGQDKIRGVLREITRITRKAVLLNEWNLEQSNSSELSLWFDLHWIHDYRLLLEGFVSTGKVSITKLPKDLWADAGWREYGSLIEVNLI